MINDRKKFEQSFVHPAPEWKLFSWWCWGVSYQRR